MSLLSNHQADRSYLPDPTQHPLPELPQAALVNLLQKVQLRDRLRMCVVCKAWNSAAACTTVNFEVSATGSDSCSHVQTWLERFGGQVCSISISNSDVTGGMARLLLPCSKLTRLQRLHARGFRLVFAVQDSSASTQHGVSKASSLSGSVSELSISSRSCMRPSTQAEPSTFLPRLKHLDISNCSLSLDSFKQLEKLSGLTSLQLSDWDLHKTDSNLCVETTTGMMLFASATAVQAVLGQLSGLVELKLGGGYQLDPKELTLCPLRKMHHLQCASFSADICSTAALTHLPRSLTCLSLTGYPGANIQAAGLSFSPAIAVHLSALQQLEIDRLILEPQVIVSLSTLQKLALRNVGVSHPVEAPGGTAAGDEGEDEWFEDNDDRAYKHIKMLLEAVGKLEHLKDLELTGMDLALVEDQQLFTALTASSELTALHISEDEEVVSVFPELTDNGHRLTLNTPLPLPPQALVSALPLGKQWPQLCSLHIKRAPYNPANWCIEAMDMAVIANTLPALANLSLLRVVRDSGVVSGLAALPHLTQLCIGGDAFDDTAAAVVAKVTTLRDLQLISAPVTTAGLQELTALRGLTLLLLEDLPDVGKGLFPVRANGTEEKTLSLTTNSEAVACGTSDVWVQLRELCLSG